MSEKKSANAENYKKNESKELKKSKTMLRQDHKQVVEHEECCGFCHEPKPIEKKKK